jgi:hypothetical protein
MSMLPVQTSLAIHGASVPGSITLGAAPTVGNLLIAFVGCAIGFSSITIGSGWTLFQYVMDVNAQTVMTAMYRYVQAGDTAALPAFWTAGSTYWTHDVYEVPNVSGTWANDFLCAIPMCDSLTTANLPPFPVIANGLAITSVARYDGSANWSISGSWTLDNTANNAGNYGSAGGASRVISSGQTIDGAWSGGGTSSPFGGLMVMLTTSQPSGGVYPRNVFQSSGSGIPGSVTVPWVPKVGSLLLAYLYWSNGSATNPTVNTSKWTDQADATLTTKAQLLLYRYVQIGDTSALPALATAGSSNWAVIFVELVGGSGTFGSDHVSDKVGAQANGATLTSTADTTTANNQVGLLSYGNYDGNGLMSTTGFSGYLDSYFNFGNWGSYFVAFKFFPTSGSTVQGTMTPNNSSEPQSYIQSIFNQGAGETLGTVAQTLFKISQAAVGADVQYDGTVHQTLGLLKQSAVGNVAQTEGHVSQMLFRVTQALVGGDVAYDGVIRQTLFKISQRAEATGDVIGTSTQVLFKVSMSVRGIVPKPAGTGNRYVVGSGI